MAITAPVRKTRTPRAAKVAANTTVRTFVFNKETKGTVRFTEQGDNPVVGELYMKKSAHAAMGGGKTVTGTFVLSA